MNKVGKNGKRLMANLWSMQAILKLILISSPSLMLKHCDLYESLHTQNANTEQSHCHQWESLIVSEKWKFV